MLLILKPENCCPSSPKSTSFGSDLLVWLQTRICSSSTRMRNASTSAIACREIILVMACSAPATCLSFSPLFPELISYSINLPRLVPMISLSLAFVNAAAVMTPSLELSWPWNFNYNLCMYILWASCLSWLISYFRCTQRLNSSWHVTQTWRSAGQFLLMKTFSTLSGDYFIVSKVGASSL